ncbi:hypothetical protein FRC04_009991 [Tulasnella sp. 424]|nr:hypothetical protein FRC04_009991 [Tulasnella sp. 424]KAG8957797.1 hypothetical protein FRC05_009608 [Tulasnella sp. 425]
MTAQITRLTREVQDLQQQLGRRDRRVQLLEREDEGLKALQATYDAEEARFGSGAEVKGASSRRGTGSPFDDYGREVGSEDAKAMIAELEAELAESMEAANNAADKIADLEQQLFELRATINAANHVPPKTRVV